MHKVKSTYEPSGRPEGTYCRVSPSIKFSCTPGWRETLCKLSVLPKNTAQCPRPGLEPEPLDPDMNTLTRRLTRLTCCTWVVPKTDNSSLTISGGYVSLAAGASDSVSFLSSPVFNIHNYEWKCLRFWYLIHISDRIAAGWFEATLKMVLDEKTTDQTRLLFFTNTLTHSVRYMQMPLPRNFTNIQVFRLFLLHGHSLI